MFLTDFIEGKVRVSFTMYYAFSYLFIVNEIIMVSGSFNLLHLKLNSCRCRVHISLLLDLFAHVTYLISDCYWRTLRMYIRVSCLQTLFYMKSSGRSMWLYIFRLLFSVVPYHKKWIYKESIHVAQANQHHS